jgi:hypothetical protein
LTYDAAITRNGGLLEAALRSLPLPIAEPVVKELARLAQHAPLAEEPA